MASLLRRQRYACVCAAIVGLSLLVAERTLRAQPSAPATPVVIEGGAVEAVEVSSGERIVAVAEASGDSPQPQPPPQPSKQGGRPGKSPGQPGQPGQPPKGGKPGEEGNKKEGEGGEKKEEEGPASVKRPDKPPRVPDPREFDVKLDDQGRVPAFNFIGQAWPDVLQWFAKISKCSLDWQELPNDYLNLTTQHPYSIDEVRDVINRHLSARGYTSIQTGEELRVFKIEKLDPSLVPRVKEDELYDLKPYDFVKVSFELPSTMEVDKAKDDVKQVLSPSAKILPLVSSKQLLVLDSVANLRTVSELLNQERMVQDGRIVPKEIVLKHARPQKVIEILYVILGIDPKGKPAQTDPAAQQQQMQMIQQMQQQGRDVSKLLKGDQPKVYLAYNRQRNSVLVNAPPEQLKIIERTISYLDVSYGSSGEAADAGATGSTERTMKKYPLTTLDPRQFLTTLEEIGGLSPMTDLKVDDDSRILFAMATAVDHAKISGLIDQFDGSGRQFEVVWLRKLPADAVAASINTLMGSQAQKEDRNRYYDPWDYDPWREREERRKKQIKGFGVDADIERNRLLLWANEAEMKRVRDLLVKLGELPGAQQTDSRPVRLIAPADAKDTAAIIEKLRAAWPASGGNQLIIKAPPAKPVTPPAEKTDAAEKPAATEPAARSSAAAEGEKSAEAASAGRVAARYVQLSAETQPPASSTGNSAAEPRNAVAAESASEPAANSADQNAVPASPAPVTITVTEDGRLMLSSSDTAALDRLEELIDELTPPEKRFRIFPCKYIRASEMWFDLTDFFKEDLEGSDKSFVRDWNGFMVPMNNGPKDTGTGLSKRRKLMITYDRPSNSILVANANATQLAEIQQLIDQFDRPTRSDSVEVRQTAAIKIQYSKPTIIAAAVKEVYRDLLSKRDKEFDHNDKREQQSASEHMTVLSFGPSSSDASNERTSPVKIGFDGALSLGADDVSGVLIVSAQKALFDDIVRMIRELDNEAAPKTTVHVHHVNGNVSAKAIQQALDKAVGKAWLGNRPEQQPAQTGQPGDQKGQKNRNNNNRGEQQNEGNSNGNNANSNEGQ